MSINGGPSLARGRSRWFVALVLAAAASIGVSGVVYADSVTGTTGHYRTTDTAESPAATCRYTQIAEGTGVIDRIVIRPPSVWWPNRSSTNSTEHGRVAWRATVGRSTDMANWTYRNSPLQYATAYEATRAPFTNITVDINAGAISNSSVFRVIIKAQWYRRDGTVLGSVRHDVKYLRERLGTTGGVYQGTCHYYTGAL